MHNFTMFCYVCYFIIFIITHIIVPCTTFTCIHDEVTFSKPTTMSARSTKTYYEIIQERTNDPLLYEPLHIYFYLDDFDPSTDMNAVYNIELSLDKIKDFIAKTFQVRKRVRPFLLERIGCNQRWQHGVNRGKCSKFKGNSEICATKNLNYTIRDRFLDKLEVYNFKGEKPIHSLPSGPGLLNSNFVTFITSKYSEMCEGSDVHAYGAYCRLDPQTNEPLAGILNLCPDYLQKAIFPMNHYYNVLLHELFHILGFSFNLFEKYLPCQKGIYCNIPKSIIQEDSVGTPRMMFPYVIESMQSHFKCNNSDFGGPIAVENTDDNKSDIIYSSHWDPLLMYSSIMSPKFSEYDHIFVDNITLATFASTGWYKINFESGSSFKFGEGQGCDFGIGDSCNNSYLCDPKLNSSGCDFLHKTIGRCTSLTPSHTCGVYEPYSEENCELHFGKKFKVNLQSIDYQSKCLMTEDIESTFTPSCFPVKCRAEDSYNVFINMTWLTCYNEEPILLDNSTLLCADSLLFCSGARQVIPRTFCPSNKQFFIAIRIYFKSPDFKDLVDSHSFRNFKVTVLKGVAERINIPVNYIVNATLNVFKKMYLDFCICPPIFLSSEELNVILTNTQKFLDDGNFVEALNGGAKELMIASSDISIEKVNAITFNDYEGFRVLLAFPVLCAVFLISTFVASLIRLYLIQKHRPKRTMENQIEIQLSETNLVS